MNFETKLLSKKTYKMVLRCDLIRYMYKSFTQLIRIN